MGSVYLSEDTRLGRHVALKVILPELSDQPDFRRRFEAEARAAAAIEHPNVVPVYSAGLLEGRLYLAMRFVDGQNLNQALDSHGPLGKKDSARILAQVASALDAAHAAGLVHRDVAPANILLEGELGADGVYLTDFGLVRGLESEGTQLTRTHEVIANLDYAAPEQIQGDPVDARTDVYALGCVLYRMRSGARPFPGTDTQKMWKIVNEPLPPLRAEDDPLDRVIARATAKNPNARYPSAGDLAHAAGDPSAAVTKQLPERSIATGRAAAGYLEADAQPTTPLPRPTQFSPDAQTQVRSEDGNAGRKGRQILPIALGAVALLALGALAAVLLLSGNDDSPTIVRETVTTTEESPAPEPTASGGPTGEAETSAAQSAEVEEGAPLPGLERFSGVAYSGFVPAGWDQELVDKPVSTYIENVWREPSDPENTFIRVDGGNPVPSESPIALSESLVEEVRQDPEYREIYYGPDFKEGREAARWVYEIDGDKRADYFFVICGQGLASVGSTSRERYPEFATMFREVAYSMQTYCE